MPTRAPEGPQTSFGEAEGRLGGGSRPGIVDFGKLGGPGGAQKPFQKVGWSRRGQHFWPRKGPPPLSCRKSHESLRICDRKAPDFEGPPKPRNQHRYI